MALLTIIKYPDSRLRRVALNVDCFDDTLQRFVKDMIETMYHDGGIGLAAAQVADQRALFVMDATGLKSPCCYINPELISSEGSCTQDEGCLSFPGVYASVTRPESIVIRAYDESGMQFEVKKEGLEARCILHEMDHLKGKMFIDHLSPLKRRMIEKKYQKQVAALSEH